MAIDPRVAVVREVPGVRWVSHSGLGGLLIATIAACQMVSTPAIPSGGGSSSAAAAPTASREPGPTWTCPPRGEQIIPGIEASAPSGQVVEVAVAPVGAMICGDLVIGDGGQVIGDALVEPAEPLLIAPGDRIRLSLPAGWQVVRVEVVDRPLNGGPENIAPAIKPDSPSSWVEISSPARSGDSILWFSLDAVTDVGGSRLTASAGLLIRQR